ncbi:MAG: tRNA pseudouridine(38-40) synthase TruA, partial [Gemmatimonadetes bacterium]|nr:tRNA pseudouridine(38-40) synthase TruA [Gemmatimonadota bacterium]NIQ55543.1 tRNA pseudouridine(38-40) synthase TruA [Gemmatimonadota bacterium]NIU72607.1 tRNA pseudouridine(38-40) synthase TruA [Gammaproteobacteria bacterium]NIX45400.1 tRNA pseudouridine(38-40) synthase TruA [Gemmatimonadota bacterium]
CWALDEPVDATALYESAAATVGDHSFYGFAKSGQEARGHRCRVTAAEWRPWAMGLELHITANRFLHHMVRYLVGTMVDVGKGRRPARDVPALLAGTAELTTSPPAPPEGLYLARVHYGDGEAAEPDDALP